MTKNNFAGTNPGCGNQEWETGTKTFAPRDYIPVDDWAYEINVVVCILEHLAPLLRDADNVHPEYSKMVSEAYHRLVDTYNSMREQEGA